MRELIGIACGHGEQVTPDRAEYTLFFELLRSEGRRTEPIEGEITLARLSEMSALLIGEPHATLSRAEIAAIRHWVKSGGHLLALSAIGGDGAPGGITTDPTEPVEPDAIIHGTNLGELLPFAEPYEQTLGIDRGILENKPFDTKVIVDISALVGQEASLCYDTGITFEDCTARPVDAEGYRNYIFNITGEEPFEPVPPEQIRKLAVPRGSSVINLFFHEEGRGDIYGQPYQADGLIYVSFRDGAGTIHCFGSSWSFCDNTIVREDNLLFASWLFREWIPRLDEQELLRRMRGPQRHRLLHGYPMASLMRPVPGEDGQGALTSAISPAKGRPLLIGVLPHPFCNPKVKGCGFCTFPHEVFKRDAASRITSAVAQEVAAVTERYPELRNRLVKSIYIGGGTANLTPKEELMELCRTLSDRFAINAAEITLEGVPIYFLTNDLLPILSDSLQAPRLRLSMGIQSFAERELQRMGRAAFGDARTVESVIEKAHKSDVTVSGDLLFNLPGQTRAEMIADVDQAVKLGLDQICLYHLVLFDGIGTEWSKDANLLANLPKNDDGCKNFLELRERLLEAGYEQRSLTNFELKEHLYTQKEFLYERSVFRPEAHTWLGFGPGAISMVCDESFRRALKLRNPESAAEYSTAVTPDRPAWQKYFAFAAHDMKILYVTRKIAALGFDRRAYRDLFGTDVTEDFPHETQVLIGAGLIRLDCRYPDQHQSLPDGTDRSPVDRWSLTPRGMFYADSIAGLFAWRRVAHLRMREKMSGRPLAPERRFYVEQRDHMG